MSLFSKIFGKKETSNEEYPKATEGMKAVVLKGIGMHWGSCKPLVEEALQELDGIKDFKVELPPKDQVYIIFDPTVIKISQIKEAIVEIGYGVKEVEEK